MLLSFSSHLPGREGNVAATMADKVECLNHTWGAFNAGQYAERAIPMELLVFGETCTQCGKRRIYNPHLDMYFVEGELPNVDSASKKM